jgi:hypothetical protein
MSYVRILDGAVDQSENGDTIVRGRIDPKSLFKLKADDYQREVMADQTIQMIMDGFAQGAVPDVILGMRGLNFEPDSSDPSVFILKDSVYIVDGLQRVTAARRLHQGHDIIPRLGAAVHLGTNKDWEVDMFKTLNASRTKVSPNVLLRNTQGSSPIIRRLYAMSNDANKGFVISGRITWNQYAQRGELITAVVLLKVIGALHRHLGKGTSVNSNVFQLTFGLEAIAESMTEDMMFRNVQYFFDLVDECWSLNGLLYKSSASQVKATFLTLLARILSDHVEFWRNDTELFLNADDRRKLAMLKINSDSDLQRLASATGRSRDILYAHIVGHMNKGRRTNLLTARTGAMIRLAVQSVAS